MSNIAEIKQVLHSLQRFYCNHTFYFIDTCIVFVIYHHADSPHDHPCAHDPCDFEYSVCTENLGGYSCICKIGFTGNGTVCEG